MGQVMSSMKNPQNLLQLNRGRFEEHEEHHKQLIPGLPDEIAMECFVRVPYQFHSTIKSVCRDWQSTVSDPCFYQLRRESGFAEDLVPLVQPLSDHLDTSGAAVAVKEDKQEERDNQKQICSPPQFAVSIYNATYDSWQKTRPVTGIPMFCQCVALQSACKILFIGGWDPATLEPVPDVHILDLAGGMRWRRGAPMSVPRSFFACAAIGKSTVYVAGGHDGQKNALKSAEVYDVEKDEWRTLPEMNEERDECQGLAWENDSKFFVVSGYGTDSQGQFRSDAECFDRSTGSWSKMTGIWAYAGTSPRGATAAVSVNGNQDQWWWFLAGEEGEGRRRWEKVSLIPVPESINGTIPFVVNLMNNDDNGSQRLMVMSGKSRGSGGGAFMLERDCINGGDKWNHIHCPSGFSGFPFSASYLQI